MEDTTDQHTALPAAEGAGSFPERVTDPAPHRSEEEGSAPLRGESAAPAVSVVVVNHNGIEHLPGLLESLREQTFPDFEVLVVDNASHDGSPQVLRRDYPWVRVLDSPKNLGFAGGNNLGFVAARGRYIALVNNDATVDPSWLEELVTHLDASSSCGAVAPKILFALPFVEVELESEAFVPADLGLSADDRRLGLRFDESSAFDGSGYPKLIFRDGFHGPEAGAGRRWRWTAGRARLLVPVRPTRGEAVLRLRLAAGEPWAPLEVGVTVGGERVGSLTVGDDFREHCLAVPADLLAAHARDVVNNAGSFLTAAGEAGDLGIFEPDDGRYDEAREVGAFCGCSVLLRRTALEAVGTFDPDFFMYYEDTELSWRLRDAGYRICYLPSSVVRHRHASTSGEGSPLFQFFVTRNRLLLLFRHAPLGRAARAHLVELALLLRLAARHRTLVGEPVRTRLRVQLSLLKGIPLALLKRLRVLRDPRLGTPR